MARKEFEFGFKIAAKLKNGFAEAFEKAGSKLGGLNDKIQKNKDLIKSLNQAQKEGVISAESYKNAVSKINPVLDKLTAKQKRLAELNKQNADAQSKMASHGATAAQYAGMLYGMTRIVKASMTFQSSMADVKKVVDFENADQFKAMSKAILDMSTKIPMTADNLATIVAAGGQSGIARQDLLKFAEAAAKMGVAFDVTADQAGDMMAKWRTAFKMNQNEVVELADKINYLGNTTAASAPLISDVVTRIGPLGSIGGVASGEIAALGASMVGSGIQSEIAATGIKNLILALVSGETATNTQAKAFAQIGLNANDMAVAMQKDAKGAILSVLKALEKLAPEKRAAVMADLFGKESLGAIGPLLSNLKGLEDNFNKVGDSINYVGSMEKEYAARCETADNATVLMQNSMRKAQIAIGNGFLPAIAPLAEKVGKAAEAVGNFASEHPNLTGAVIGSTGAILLAATVAHGAMWAITGLGAAYTGASVFMAKYEVMTKLSTATTWLWSTAVKGASASMGIARGAATLLSGAFVKLWAILMANPWIALAALAVGACILIYKNWDEIKQWFITLWENPQLAVQKFSDGVKNIMSSVADWVKDKWEGIKKFLSTPIFGKVNVTAEGSGAEVAHNARGGIYGKGAFLTTFAENSGESAIPHTPNRRNIGLLAKTNEIMGNPIGGVNINADFKPQIIVQNGNAGEVSKVLSQKMKEFEAMLNRVANKNRRVSYA